MKTGERFSRRVDYCKGDPKNPMSDEEIKNKFRRLAQRKMSSKRVEEIIAAVERIEELKDMRELARLLAS